MTVNGPVLSVPTNNVLADDGRDRIYRQEAVDVDMSSASAAIASTTTLESTGTGTGTGTPVNNVQPSLVLKPMVCSQGLFPSLS